MCPSTPEEIDKMKKIKYREAVGSLLWLALGTRPDICYAVTQVAKFNENPGPQHWDAVVRIFRYLACTLDYAIEYSPAVPSSGIEESLSTTPCTFRMLLFPLDTLTLIMLVIRILEDRSLVTSSF